MLGSSHKLTVLKEKGARPRNLLRTDICRKTVSGHSFPYDLPLNSFTPADHHAATQRSYKWQKRPKQNTRKTGFRPAIEENDENDECARCCKVKSLHHAARFFFHRLTIADEKLANVSSKLIQNKRGAGVQIKQHTQSIPFTRV